MTVIIGMDPHKRTATIEVVFAVGNGRKTDPVDFPVRGPSTSSATVAPP